MTGDVSKFTAKASPALAARPRMAWSRKLTPAQVQVIARKYQAGSNIRELMRDFSICRSTLYRYLSEYKQPGLDAGDATYWRIECERLKEVVVDLTLENKALRAREKGDKC